MEYLAILEETTISLKNYHNLWREITFEDKIMGKSHKANNLSTMTTKEFLNCVCN